MARRPSEPSDRGDTPVVMPSGAQARSAADPTRMESLAALLDHCSAAQARADALGEKFLSYLIGMAIEETRTALQQIPR